MSCLLPIRRIHLKSIAMRLQSEREKVAGFSSFELQIARSLFTLYRNISLNISQTSAGVVVYVR